MSNLPPIWTTTSPAVWAQAPEWMSLHVLLEAECCPKSIVLRRSKYPQIWTRDGYPEKPNLAGVSGQIVHVTLATIISRLEECGCTSLQDPRAIDCLREMGGYSKIISGVVSSVLGELSDNPRFVHIANHIASALRLRLPQMREQVQVLLSRMVWNGRTKSVRQRSVAGCASQVWKRSPLTLGTHFEVELRDKALKWKGIADMVEVFDDQSVITDFKTGEESDFHTLQIRVYGLLWLRDAELNPTATPAAKLVLSYPSGDQLLGGMSPVDTDALEKDLKIRSELVRQSFDGANTIAILNAETCKRCQVRHLCKEYWSSMRQKSKLTVNFREGCFDDLEVVLSERRGDTAWEAECRISDLIPSHSRVLLRLSFASTVLDEDLIPGTLLRLVGAIVSTTEGEIPLIQNTSTTEIFFHSM